MNKPSSAIVFTGGGTAGHVSALLALQHDLKRDGWDITYIGSYHGLESSLVKEAEIPYHAIFTGKLRRYISLRNISDMIKTALGCLQSLFLLRRLKPQVILSRGGYVSFPPTVAAFILRVPVVLIEADISLGLAARLSLPMTDMVFYAFKETKHHLPANKKAIHTGLPVRKGITSGDRKKGLALCGFSSSSSLPIVVVIGGSQGSYFFQKLIMENLSSLTKHFRIIFLCGSSSKYHQELHCAQKQVAREVFCYFSYLKEEIKDIYAVSDLALSRGGANSIFELLACSIPSLLIPLEQGSRGEQVENATSITQQGLAMMVRGDELNGNKLVIKLKELHQQAAILKERIQTEQPQSPHKIITEKLRPYLRTTHHR